MTGVAGKGRGEENALALARFLNQTHPAHVVNFSMFLHKEVPLYREAERGTFKMCIRDSCGKRMLSVKGKNSQMLVCQDRECGYRETVSRTSNASFSL